MNLLNNTQLRYLAYLALLTTLLALLAEFDGTVTVQITQSGLEVQIKRHFPSCLIDQPLPQKQKIALSDMRIWFDYY